jgi:hypothetical protein
VAEGRDLDGSEIDETDAEDQETEDNDEQPTDLLASDFKNQCQSAKPEPVMRRRGRPPIQR